MTRFVDVRATRFAGGLTFVGAVVAILVGHWAVPLLLAVVLLGSAWGGSRWNLWGHIYRATLARHMAAPGPAQREPDRPPRFASLLGGLFLAAAVPAYALGSAWLAAGLVAIVALLALLNAATGYCLGCRMYGVLVRDGPIVRFLGLR